MFCYTIREIKYLLSLRRDKRDLEAFARGSRLLRTRTDPSALGARPSMSYDCVEYIIESGRGTKCTEWQWDGQVYEDEHLSSLALLAQAGQNSLLVTSDCPKRVQSYQLIK